MKIVLLCICLTWHKTMGLKKEAQPLLIQKKETHFVLSKCRKFGWFHVSVLFSYHFLCMCLLSDRNNKDERDFTNWDLFRGNWYQNNHLSVLFIKLNCETNFISICSLSCHVWGFVLFSFVIVVHWPWKCAMSRSNQRSE